MSFGFRLVNVVATTLRANPEAAADQGALALTVSDAPAPNFLNANVIVAVPTPRYELGLYLPGFSWR